MSDPLARRPDGLMGRSLPEEMQSIADTMRAQCRISVKPDGGDPPQQFAFQASYDIPDEIIASIEAALQALDEQEVPTEGQMIYLPGVGIIDEFGQCSPPGALDEAMARIASVYKGQGMGSTTTAHPAGLIRGGMGTGRLNAISHKSRGPGWTNTHLEQAWELYRRMNERREANIKRSAAMIRSRRIQSTMKSKKKKRRRRCK